MQQRSYIKHNKKRITDKLLYTLPGVAVALVAGLAVAKYAVRTDGASAADFVPAMGNIVTAGVVSEMSLGVQIDGNTVLRIVPDADGAFKEGSFDVTVNTSNVFGYKLSMYAYKPNSTTPTTELTNVSTTLSGGNPTIATLDSGSSYSAEEFASSEATRNKWGYKINNEANFKPVESTTVLQSEGALGSNKETVTFGAKIDNTIPNGLYEVTLNFVAIANAPDSTNVNSSFETAFAYAGATPYDGTHYAMQDMNETICGYVYTPGTDTNGIANTKSIQLVDKRDRSVYWVSKLADGKCWMTQNLDFDITGPLKSDLTDIKTTEGVLYGETGGYTEEPGTGLLVWTPTEGHTTYKVSPTDGGDIGTGAGKWNNDNTEPYSIDAGKWYQRGTYFNSTECNDISVSVGCNFLNSSTKTATSGGLLSSYYATTPFSENGEHGAVGNWYNWSAAVASNNTTSATYNAAGGTQPNGDKPVNTICPKGWTLPETVATTNATEAGTWTNLNRLYNGNLSTTEKDTGLFNSPLYLVRGGYILANDSLTTLYNAGRIGRYGSSTASASSAAFDLHFRSADISAASANSRVNGNSLRCVAL